MINLDYRLLERNNKHTQLYLKCVVSDEEKDRCIEEIKTYDKIKVLDENSNYIFQGTAQDISLTKFGENYTINLRVESYTNQLDINLKKRTFQNLDMSYRDVVEEVLKDYPKADYLDKAMKDTKLEGMIVQFNETDWEFLLRISSKFQAPLIVDSKENYPRIYIGEPEDLQAKEEARAQKVIASKNLMDFLDSITNFKADLDENDAIYYIIETYSKFELGEQLSFRDRANIITSAECYTDKGEIKHRYILSTSDGVKTNYIENKNIIGVQLQGTVKEINRNSARIHFDIDKEYNAANNKFFSYSGGINNEAGYYMPKVGSTVNLYFPNGDENNAVIVGSIRKPISQPKSKTATASTTILPEREVLGQERMTDPREKHLRNEFGKEMRLGVKDLEFSAGSNGINVNLSEDGVATIHSSNFITIAQRFRD